MVKYYINLLNNDCEVTEIDGKPAIQAIIDFANANIAYSKDLGVQFNMALGTFSQLFTLREDLPETSNITYNLKCPEKSYALTRKWSIAFINPFFKYYSHNTSESSNKATKLQSGDKSTESTSSDRCRKDISNNIDGDVRTLSIFATLLPLPSKQPYFFPTSININNFTIPIIEKNFNTHAYGFDFYNPYSYLSFPSGEPFKNASKFIGPRTNLASSLHLENPIPNDEKFTSQWTSDDFLIITNGFCADTCALNTLLLSEFHKVKTIAIDGLLDTPMSFSTFPGGSDTTANEIASSSGDKILNVPEKISLLLL
ncbi:peptidase s41 family protein [Gigaspora margarita]|uniref:Peptidase s41 family protein n=1 Tax=Gigaspora margarita TaxID=4874 RepID=A0A8H4AZQ8_GIGMA|nr:peptidase s41 family protein [Gigaspora margarita]